MRDRFEVRAQVLECVRCELNVRCTAPVPFAGTFPGQVAVVKEAPSISEDKSGVPHDAVLAEALEDLGITEVCWLNVVSCAPILQEEPLRTRMPTTKEINACLPNLKAQLEAAGARHIILAGAVPLRVFRPDLKMSREHGVPFWRFGRMFLPIYNPQAAVRNPAWLTELRTDLAVLTEFLDESPEVVQVHGVQGEASAKE